jgi:nitrite reductase/ring-hydroxylating ferredoxin subunit
MPAQTAVVRAPRAALALFSVNGSVFAIEDACLRCGSSLAAGRLEKATVTCSQCGWRYDLVSGRVLGVPMLCTERYEARIVDGRVMIAPLPTPAKRP